MHHHFICIRGHRQKLHIRTDHQIIKSIIQFNQCIHFAIGLADISPIEELKETKPAPHGDIDFTNASTIALAGESVQMNNTDIHHDGSNCQLEHIRNHQLSTINLPNNTDEDLRQKINELNIKLYSKSISLQQYFIEMEKIGKGRKH